MTTSPPQLKWKELRDFPGEWEARVGDLVFSASATEYSIDVPEKTYIRTAARGDVESLYAAKRACQAFVNRIHRDLERLGAE